MIYHDWRAPMGGPKEPSPPVTRLAASAPRRRRADDFDVDPDSETTTSKRQARQESTPKEKVFVKPEKCLTVHFVREY